jgi:hypothetical protein
MDNQTAFAVTLSGILSFLPFRNVSLYDGLRTWLILLSALFILSKVYWMWIYPYYVSPLRHLPGPKVLFKLLRLSPQD